MVLRGEGCRMGLKEARVYKGGSHGPRASNPLFKGVWRDFLRKDRAHKGLESNLPSEGLGTAVAKVFSTS